MFDGILYYGLDGRPISRNEWVSIFSRNSERIIGSDHLNGYHVSTVWIGIDHSRDHAPPMIFETMIFGQGPLNEYCERYATIEEAREGHQKTVASVRQQVPDADL